MRFQVSALRRRSGCGGVRIVEKDIEGETRCVDTRGLVRPQREGAGWYVWKENVCPEHGPGFLESLDPERTPGQEMC